MDDRAPIEIGIIDFPGAQIAAIHGLADLFAVADRIAGERRQTSRPHLIATRWRIAQGEGEPTRRVEDDEIAHGLPAVLVLPPRLGTPIEGSDAAPYARWLVEQHQAGAVLASICGGAFVLGATGLLAGRRTTTHWTHADEFRRRFPEAVLDVDSLVIDDGDIVSAGGLMAWIDLGLKLVDRFLGPTIMADTARFMLVDPPGREQRFYSAFSPNLSHGDLPIVKVQHWLQASGAKDMAVASMASHAGLEERTFLRRFRKATGLTAVDYCQRLRVGRASELLQFGSTSVDAVAWEVGYGDPGAFRKVFARVTGLSPSEYRRRFSLVGPKATACGST